MPNFSNVTNILAEFQAQFQKQAPLPPSPTSPQPMNDRELKFVNLPFRNTSHFLLIISITIIHYFPNHLWRQVFDSYSNSLKIYIQYIMRTCFRNNFQPLHHFLKYQKREGGAVQMWLFMTIYALITIFFSIR